MSDKRFVDSLPAPLRQPVDKALKWASGMSKQARILVISTVVALVVLGTFFGMRGSNPTYATLFSNLERDDAAQVVAKLKEMKVPYRLEGDGTVIEVPEANARELRLELAGAGLPRGGAVGFESFDKMRLGATEFEQRIMYRRALEGELSRTIGSVAAIQNARVHLVLPEKSVFVSKNEPSSASVVLKLRGGRALGQGEVSSIVHLVSTSVAGLSPDHVSIVTTEGTVLHKPKALHGGGSGEGADGGDDERAAQARQLEATLEERARSMVEKVTGPGKVDVRVTADIDSSKVEHIEDHYDPTKSALRSEEKSVERAGGEEIPVAGVPGAESNLPGGAPRLGAAAAPAPAASAANAADGGAPVQAAPAAALAATTAGGTMRESHTRNFEIDHVTEKRTVNGGVLRRLTVAVVVDQGAGVNGGLHSKEEMEKISSLVRNAVGYDAQRGDAVTVEAVPFLGGAAPEAAPEPSLLSRIPPKKLYGAAGALALVTLVALALAVRSMKKKSAVRTALAIASAKEKAAVEAVQVEILAPEPKKDEGDPDELRRLVKERAQLDPATAALVVRSWLGSLEKAQTEDVAA